MVVVNEGALLSTVDRIYEAIERPELWPKTIDAIGELIGGRRHFWGLDPGTPIPDLDPTRKGNPYDLGCYGTFFLSQSDLQALDQYAQEFGELIIRFLKIIFLSIIQSQNEVAAREAIGLKMVQRYVEGFEPTVGFPGSSRSSPIGRKLIAALWEEGRVFNSDNLRSMRLLIPHLDRALRLQMRFKLADLQKEMLSGTLDYLAHGVVLVDSSGQPLWLNKRAQEMVKESDDLQLCRAGLRGRRPLDTQSLRDFIGEVVLSETHGIMPVNRGDDRRPLLLIAAPLRPPGIFDNSNQAVGGVVFISDPDRVDNPSVESLRRAFNFTYREAQTAIAIADGHGLQAAADAMGVALTTARSQLQQAFAKTGTHHQAELSALVHRTLTHVLHN
jgi:DNA-binding CsgD family transcriptional regulator/PAS domain-containing protein